MADGNQVPPNAVVTYNVGQLLDTLRIEMSTALSRIETKLDTKADKADLVELRKDLEFHSERLSKLEIQDVARQSASASRDQHSETEAQRRARRREAVYGFLMCLLTVGIVLGSLGVHI